MRLKEIGPSTVMFSRRIGRRHVVSQELAEKSVAKFLKHNAGYRKYCDKSEMIESLIKTGNISVKYGKLVYVTSSIIIYSDLIDIYVTKEKPGSNPMIPQWRTIDTYSYSIEED